MGIEITSITNQTLRHAAEVADLNDNTANSGKLDTNELVTFVREAVRSNCDMEQIAELCNQVGVEHASDDVKASMEKLNQLQKLEKELKYQTSILEQRENEIKELDKQDEDRISKEKWMTFGTFAGGAAAGATIGAAIGNVPGAIIGGLIGAFGGLFANTKCSDDAPSNHRKIREFEEQKLPVKNKVNELKKQMEDVAKTL